MNESDVVFLLTDSREARWLPTIIHAASDNKPLILINVALGFDTFRVMRHGHNLCSSTYIDNGVSSNPRLGCYFCNDIIGVTNTLKDRTLDQQCTVTRPGLAYMAAAWAVEMMIGLLHCDDTRPLGSVSIGSMTQQQKHTEANESNIPHQIRGSLLGYNQVLPMVRFYYYMNIF